MNEWTARRAADRTRRGRHGCPVTPSLASRILRGSGILTRLAAASGPQVSLSLLRRGDGRCRPAPAGATGCR